MAETNQLQNIQVRPSRDIPGPCCDKHTRDGDIQNIALPVLKAAEKERSQAVQVSHGPLSPLRPPEFSATVSKEDRLSEIRRSLEGNFNPGQVAVQLGVHSYQSSLEKAKRFKKEIFALEGKLEKHLNFTEELRVIEEKGEVTAEVRALFQELDHGTLKLGDELVQKLQEDGAKLTKRDIELLKHRVQRQVSKLERESNRKAHEITFIMEHSKGILAVLRRLVEQCDRVLEKINRNSGR